MSDQNEFSGYSTEELEIKKLKLKKTQRFIMILCVVMAAIAMSISIFKNTNQLYPIMGLMLFMGIGYPFMAFVPTIKKIQSEIDSRSSLD